MPAPPPRGNIEAWVTAIRRTLERGGRPKPVREIAATLRSSPNTTGKYVALGKSSGRLTVERVGTSKLVGLPMFERDARRHDRLRPSDYVNHLFEGDCIEEMEKIPDGAIDMVLCDLPYGTTQNPWDSVIPLDKLWRAYHRVVKDDGAIVLTGQGAFTAHLIVSNESEFRYKIAWEKSKPTNFLNARRQPLRKHEAVCVFYRRQPIYNPQMAVGEPYSKGVRKDQLSGSYGDFKPVLVASRSGDRFPTDVVYFKTAESEGKVWHPTQKPVSLGRYLIRTFTRPGEVVLDNAFGSGSFLVAAVLEGRNYVGIEKNEEMRQFKRHPTDYVAIAQHRLREATQKAAAGVRTSRAQMRLPA